MTNVIPMIMKTRQEVPPRDISVREAAWCTLCVRPVDERHSCATSAEDHGDDAVEEGRITPLVALVLALTACFSTPPKPIPAEVTVVVAVLDTSDSGRDPIEVRCAEVGAYVARALEHTKRADVLVLATGPNVEPVIVVGWRRFAEPRRVAYEGDRDHGAQARQEFVSALVEDCHKAIRPTNTSPVYAAVDRAASAIRGRCAELARGRERCADDGRYLLVASDLLETRELGLARRLDTTRRTKQERTARIPALPPPISLAGIKATFCGLSGTDESTPRANAQLVEGVWRQAIVGDDIVFTPICDRLEVK